MFHNFCTVRGGVEQALRVFLLKRLEFNDLSDQRGLHEAGGGVVHDEADFRCMTAHHKAKNGLNEANEPLIKEESTDDSRGELQ